MDGGDTARTRTFSSSSCTIASVCFAFVSASTHAAQSVGVSALNRNVRLLSVFISNVTQSSESLNIRVYSTEDLREKTRRSKMFL
jgi:1-aminocyclopropane-1-carboxylate deaminase/D-cysteine desulfhydrase-like pyridoxal-dependent ACC family enzyme